MSCVCRTVKNAEVKSETTGNSATNAEVNSPLNLVIHNLILLNRIHLKDRRDLLLRVLVKSLVKYNSQRPLSLNSLPLLIHSP